MLCEVATFDKPTYFMKIIGTTLLNYYAANFVIEGKNACVVEESFHLMKRFLWKLKHFSVSRALEGHSVTVSQCWRVLEK